MRVIIIEDEEKARQLIVHLLYAVDEQIRVVGQASNAEEGKKLIQSMLPDVVFLDIKMPGKTGIELVRELADSGYHIQYFIISGYDEFSYAQEAIELGIKGYILKPVSYRDIEHAVNKARQELTGISLGAEERRHLPVMELGDLFVDLDEKCPMIKKAVEYICKNMSLPCNLSDTACELNISSEYLSRNFHEEMGITFMAFVRMVKIDYACVLLEKTDMKIYEIAKATGYKNDKYFCNTFKKVMGMQPQKYRNRIRK